MVSDSDRVAPLESSLHYAALIMLTALATVLVAQMDLDPRDAIARMGQRLDDDTSDPGLQRFVMLDIVVGIDLDQHGVSSVRARVLASAQPTTADELKDDHDDSNHEQGVDEASRSERSDQAKSPKDQKYNSDSVKHDLFS